MWDLSSSCSTLDTSVTLDSFLALGSFLSSGSRSGTSLYIINDDTWIKRCKSKKGTFTH
jgi:hypothetical protein